MTGDTGICRLASRRQRPLVLSGLIGALALAPVPAFAQDSTEGIGRSLGVCMAATTLDGVQEATLVDMGFALDTRRSNRFAAYYEAAGAAPIELSVSIKPINTCTVKAFPKDDMKVVQSALESELGEAQWTRLGDPYWNHSGRTISMSPPRGITSTLSLNITYLGDPAQ
jgi:hypothetical protein